MNWWHKMKDIGYIDNIQLSISWTFYKLWLMPILLWKKNPAEITIWCWVNCASTRNKKCTARRISIEQNSLIDAILNIKADSDAKATMAASGERVAFKKTKEKLRNKQVQREIDTSICKAFTTIQLTLSNLKHNKFTFQIPQHL